MGSRVGTVEDAPRRRRWTGLHRRYSRRSRIALTVGATVSFLGAATIVTSFAATSGPDGYTFFANADVSSVPTDPDTAPVELGLRFTTNRPGELTAVRFLKARGDRGGHQVSVWSADGRRLGTTTASKESRSGWQSVKLPTPVRLAAGQTYVVSYFTSRYKSTEAFFGRTITAGPLATVGVAGVYSYGGGFPTKTWQASNYWVDVEFTPRGADPPATTPAAPAPTTPAAPSPSATPSASPTASAPPGGAPELNLSRVAWEGGPSYYDQFAQARAAGWTKPGFFPIAVWYEGVYTQEDIDKDLGAGLNTYIMTTDQSDVALIRRNGMSAMIAEKFANRGSESVAWMLADEADMWGGPGNGTWTGKWPGQGEVCTSGKLDCGHDVLKKLAADVPADDGRMRFANYGKGVMFWQSDSEAAKFVNAYTSVVANDVYWYTDPHVCDSASEGPAIGVKAATCRRAANYGRTMDEMRKLDGMDGKRQPVFAFVEVGHPFTEDDAPTITGNQIAGAVMNSLIHEARGVIYFNHNFGGPCESQHVLRDSCGAAVRPAVTEVNKRIAALAPVLNTQSYAWEFNTQLDTMLKVHGGSYYVFAMPGRTGGTGQQKLSLPAGMAGRQAEVLFEGRSVPIVDGAIQDNFAEEHTYHIYKITP